jgi:hypothetical protein
MVSFLNQEDIVLTELAVGGPTLKATGNILLVGTLVVIEILFVFFLHTVIIYRASTGKVRGYARYTVLGGCIYGLIPVIIYAANLTGVIPGAIGISASLGLLITGISSRMYPELHTVALKSSNDAKRRYLMNRFHFHDILNTAATISSSVEMLVEFPEVVDRDYYLNIIQEGMENMIEELQEQRFVLAAEHDQLIVDPQEININDLLKETVESFSAMTVRQDT